MRQRAKSPALLLILAAAAALSVGCAGNKSKGGSDYSSFEGSSSAADNSGPSEQLLEAKRSAEAAEAEASQLRQEKQKAASN